jgi:hypothetical protein
MLVLLIPISIAEGPPATPVRFDGTVTVNGEAVEDGTVVSVKIGDENVDTQTINSRYSIQVPSNNEEEYIFYVSGVETGRHIVPNSGSYIPFDLSVIIITTSDSGSSGDNSGGGSGGGGGGGSSTVTNVLTEEYQSFQISINRGKAFQFDDEKHIVTVNGVSGNTVKLNLDSEDAIFSMSSGETKEVDLQANSDYLLSINVESVSGSTANILLKLVLRPESVIEDEKKAIGEIIETESVIEDKDNSFAAITGAFAGLPDLSILQNIYFIIAVFIIVVVLLFMFNKSAKLYIKQALRKAFSGGNDKTKK